tara:strand:+ start:6167 stop:6391 length:225 start_codon:yes stop_codon:yes gene_type:complete
MGLYKRRKDEETLDEFSYYMREKLGTRDYDGNPVGQSGDFYVYELLGITLLFHSDGLVEVLQGQECVWWGMGVL